MLSEKFLAHLSGAFPGFYERVNDEAMREADRLLQESGGDARMALVRARMHGAARLWWPYVKGTLPVVGDKRDAMEGFARLVLTVDHVVGYKPQSMEAARDQVTTVLRDSLDFERLARLVERKAETEDAAEKAAAGATGAGIVAGLGALMSPITMYRNVRKYARFVPPPMRVALGAVIVAAVLSVPLVAGYSAGLKAEEAARNYGEPLLAEGKGASSPARKAAP